MSETVDHFVGQAVAAPHDATRRKALADYIDEHVAGGAAVAAAVRGDRRGPAVLRAAWQIAQDRNLELSYQLLWAVVTFAMDRPAARPRPAPVPEPVPEADPEPANPPLAPWVRRGGPTWRDRTDDRRLAILMGLAHETGRREAVRETFDNSIGGPNDICYGM